MDEIYDIKGSKTIILKKKCPSCKADTRMGVEGSKYIEYEYSRKHITEVFPELSVFEREFLMTGYCVKCQEKIFRRKAKKKDIESFC